MTKSLANVIPYPAAAPSTLTSLAADLTEVKKQVNLIQKIMKEVMKAGEHYGTIPGCGDKKVLLKPGAEKLMLTFRLSNDLEVSIEEMPNFHREYRVKVTIFSPSGQRLGTGVGSCSTMESKYRYRSEGKNTGKLVPREYWNLRSSNPEKAQELLGGKGFTTKKVIDTYYIFQQGERVENDNPADCYNTCLKMAKKRGFVDAILSSTAASDIFTQDLDEDYENELNPNPAPNPVEERGENQQPASSRPTTRTPDNSTAEATPAPGSNDSRANNASSGSPSSRDDLLGYLSGKQIKHEVKEDGMIYAYPEFSDANARTWLKDQKFRWDSKLKAWKL
jgi:hypothetical protein